MAVTQAPIESEVVESQIAELLHRVSVAQDELLALLAHKRELLGNRDHRALAALSPREEELAAELRACHDARTKLLASASQQGLPSDSIESLAGSLPNGHAGPLHQPILEAKNRAELLQHESLAQWVVMQRTVLHLSQMLEIIATGGRSRPTYEKGRSVETSGALMDRAV
jgi:FlgN protein